MKTTGILQAVIVLMIVALVTSCRSSREYPSRRYPKYPYPEERYPRRDYPIIIIEPHRLPPGQAKKLYGYRSAKPFAPGQQKKYGYYYHNRYDGTRWDDEREYGDRGYKENHYGKHKKPYSKNKHSKHH